MKKPTTPTKAMKADMMMDKKKGIKEGSAKDKKLDAKLIVAIVKPKKK